MARAAVIPAKSPKRATRTTKKTTTTTTTSRSAGGGVSKPVARTTRTKATSDLAETKKRGGWATPMDEDTDSETDDELNVIEPARQNTAPKVRGRAVAAARSGGTTRGRKPATPVPAKEDNDISDDGEAAPVEAPKKRAGRPKAKAAPKLEEVPKSEPAPRTRGRPKGSTNKSTKAGATEKTSTTQKNPKEVLKTTNSALMKSNILRGPAKKKKVTFQDVSDSEDMGEPTPPPPTARKRGAATARQTGLAGKPARKTAATPARGRKPAATKKGTSKPLSPKKATQVAKSLSSYASSDGEDDELSGGKSPIKLFVTSPQKHGSETTGLSSPVKRINFTSAQAPPAVDENGEPAPRQRRSIDFNETLLMSSPARRPTPSPFNYTIRETPRRGGFALRDDPKPLAQPNFTPTQNSPLKSSPRKAHLGTPRLGGLGFIENNSLSQANFTPGQSSPLKSSPRKGIFGASFSSHVPPQESSTPFKSRSLLMSPAKKVASPFKSSMLAKSSPLVERSQPYDEHSPDIYVSTNVTPDESPLQTFELDDEMGLWENDHMEGDLDEMELELDIASKDHRISLDDEEMENHAGSEHDECSPPREPNEAIEDHVGSSGEALEQEAQEPTDHPIETASNADEEDIEEPLDLHEFERVADNDDSDQAEEDTPGTGADPVDDKFHDPEHVDDNDDQDEPEEDAPEAETDPVGDEFEKQNEDQAQDIGDEIVDALVEGDPFIESEPTETVDEVFAIDDQVTSNQVQDEEPVESTATLMTMDERDAFESKSAYQEDGEEHLDKVEPDVEIEGIHKLWDSPYRQSLVAGLEDVFMDAPLAADSPVVTGERSDDEIAHQPDEKDHVSQDLKEGTLTILDTACHDLLEPETVAPYEIDEIESSTVKSDLIDILPPAPTPPECADYRDLEAQESSTEDMESEAEQSQLGDHSGFSPSKPEQPNTLDSTKKERSRPRFTLLAEQLSGWKASSPEKSQPSRPRRRGVFSLAGNLKRTSDMNPNEVSYPSLPVERQSPPASPTLLQGSGIQNNTPGIFEDRQEELEENTDVMGEVGKSPRPPLFEIFEDSQVGPTEGGAEESPAISNKGNSPIQIPPPAHEAAPDDEKENENILPTLATPAKNITNPMQTFHTVSKVPLRPEGHISPLKMPRKRGRSLSMTSPVRSSPRIRKSILVSREQTISMPSPRKSPRQQQTTAPRLQPPSSSRSRMSVGSPARSTKAVSRSPSPSKTPRRNVNACEQVLGGAVVFVDVHTTEGEDASGIFVELLQQMGARCVRNWAWNPRASLSPTEEQMPKDGRIGITHVVYKDGGVRTLEKVRQAGGVVKCVGVGWVLDCERENKWLEEAHYAVDSSIIPRGGAKRRKSMEPRALSNVNGTLVKGNVGSPSASASGRRSGADRETMEDFRRHTPPLSSRDDSSDSATPQKFLPGHTEADQEFCQTPKTPGSSAYDFANLDRIGMSPATPFYLSQRSRLVQQTCPPKQTQQGLFSNPGPSEESSRALRARLEAARRRSLAFKPKVGSPLIE
ncbi:hypothetical protein FE257_012294 [Aspergillus nanangensis]|uniref:BRCT domain-containing protein n=1 Tax=Aspergillus nanangensis TaxID=2582783 RepID=A0AAD4GQT5_ASPNN|nr:hypothetical protein FE257_012294 [Aspergillus nanangensis]